MMKKTEEMINSKIQNDELKKAIEDLKKDNSQPKQIAMFEQLRNANLLVPAIFNVDLATDKVGKLQVPTGTQIKFILVNSNDGKVFFPAFTDIEEAQKMPLNQNGKIQYIVRTLKDFQPMLEDANNAAEGMVINPSGASIVIPTGLVKQLNAAPVKQSEKADIPIPAQVRFSEPTLYPTALVNAVHDACETKENILRVWLKSMIAGPVVSFALIIEMDIVKQEVLEEIKQVALPLSKGLPVVTIALDEELKKNVIQESFPLYDKELGL